jgi:GDP/UDP-N,N'-diacetylbacillosamine 2-epimerase (hydrolysing)
VSMNQNSSPKKILFFTSTRADYGILSSLIKRFSIDSQYTTKILVTGTHLSDRFGGSIQEILADGFSVDYKVDLELSSDSDVDIAKSAGLGVQRFAQVLKGFHPDLAIVLGDRFEALSFAMSCQIMQVPLAHLHGGEITEGAIDNSFRHCITKLSSLHFASAEVHKTRIIQMGESPDTVFNVGALGVDNVVHLQKKSKSELQSSLGIQFKLHNFMVTFHPETLILESSESQMKNFLSGLQGYLDQDRECYYIFTLPNTDPGYQTIIDQIHLFVEKNKAQSIVFSTMGRLNYMSALKYCCGVLGNSSSGLIEAPALGLPTLNVGDRQKGRLRANSVIDVTLTATEIVQGIKKILKIHMDKMPIESVYGDGQAAEKIKKILDLKIQNPISLRKTFYDRN